MQPNILSDFRAIGPHDHTPCPVCGRPAAVSDSPMEWMIDPYDENDKLDVLKIKLSVVVPVFNEVKTVEKILDRIQKIKINKEIIVVDDCSSDGTRDRLLVYAHKNPGLRVVLHEVNKGKGAALRTGFSHATGDIIIIQDADLEYNPMEYYRLIVPILDGRADVVYGSRFIGETHRVLFFWHYVANKILTTLSNMFTNLNLTDMETCYKVFKRDVLDGMTLKSDRFGFEPEFTAKIAKKKLRIYEMPISYSGRDYSQGKKIGWKDAINAFWCIVRFNWLEK